MTIKELKDRIDELENKKFILDMKDHWEREDYDKFDEYCLEIKILTEKINNIEEKTKNIPIDKLESMAS